MGPLKWLGLQLCFQAPKESKREKAVLYFLTCPGPFFVLRWPLCPALALWPRAGKLQWSVGGPGRGKDKQGKRLFRKTWFRTQPPPPLPPPLGLRSESWKVSCHDWPGMLSVPPFRLSFRARAMTHGSARAVLRVRALGMTSSSLPAPVPP